MVHGLAKHFSRCWVLPKAFDIILKRSSSSLCFADKTNIIDEFAISRKGTCEYWLLIFCVERTIVFFFFECMLHL